MATITNATREWQSVTLASAEIWQVRNGEIEVDTDPDAPQRLGIVMGRKDSIQLPAGTAYYRLASGFDAIISRVAI